MEADKVSMPFDSNRYLARIIRHVDGDTSHVALDLGLDVHINVTVRWANIDAPEMSTDAGKAAKAYVVSLLPTNSVCEIQTIKEKKEKFGRYLATFILNDINLNQKLIDEGFAVNYDGGHRG